MKAWAISEEVLAQAEVGWVPSRQRYALPVRDESGDVVQVVYRSLTEQPKSKTHPGIRGSHLYLPFDLDAGVVLLCAGERDAFAAADAGWNAVTVTNGEGSIPDLRRLSGRDVVVVYDADAAGARNAPRIATALAPIGRSVRVADLRPLLGSDLTSKDLSDLLAMKRGKALLRAAVTAAEPWVPTPEAEGPQPVNWAEFWSADPEPIRYLVEPLFAVGEVTRLYAQAKVGKSLLVQECAAALAVGRKVLGQAPDPASVVYIDQENTWDDWKTRLADMGYGPDDDWSQLHWYSLQSWPALDTAAGGEALTAVVARHEAVLVVIDTQSKVLEGEEDKALTSAAFYRHTLLPLKRLGVAVVIIDHAGNDASKPRGSTGKRDDVDVVWQVTPHSRDRLTLRRTHSRKRHGVDLLSVDRLVGPLRHEVAGDGAEVPSFVEVVVEAICNLQPIPPYDTSAREVGRLLREAGGGKGFRAQTVREAWKQVCGDD